MEKIIFSLIKENNRVIIPNFGAFIVAKESGFTVLFNNFLSFNDGLLIDNLAKSENISSEEAAEKVTQFVEEIKNQLDVNGRYEFDQLGVFTKDTSGILRFTQSEEINNKEEDSTNELLDLDSAPAATEKVEETVKPVITPPEAAKVNEEPLVEVEEEEEQSSGSSYAYLEEDKKKRSRSILTFLIIIILLPLIGVVVYYTVFKKDNTVKTTQVEAPVAEAPVDTLKSDKQDGIIAGPEVKEVNTIQPTFTDKPHYIIVGSFKNTDNAERMVASLREKGFDNCTTLEHNSRVLVSIDAFAKVTQAYVKQEEILDTHRIESWILTKRQ